MADKEKPRDDPSEPPQIPWLKIFICVLLALVAGW